jgi:hypothetical protein
MARCGPGPADHIDEWIMSSGMSAPAFSSNQRAAPGCHIRTPFLSQFSGRVEAGGAVDVHHPLVVGHHHVHDRVDEALRQVAIGDGEVPHRHRPRVGLERLVGVGGDHEFGNREGLDDLRPALPR